MKREEGKSQTAQILRHLKAGGSLSALEALERFQCFRLGARIHELVQRGHAIRCSMVKLSSGKRVGVYTMEH